MIFSLPCFPLVSVSQRLTLNLFMKWDYKQGETQQTSSIPFQWKRLKLALGKAVSASCSSRLATIREPSHGGYRGCVSFQAVWGGFFVYFLFFIFENQSFALLCAKERKEIERGCFSRDSSWLMLRSNAKLKLDSIYKLNNCRMQRIFLCSRDPIRRSDLCRSRRFGSMRC